MWRGSLFVLATQAFLAPMVHHAMGEATKAAVPEAIDRGRAKPSDDGALLFYDVRLLPIEGRGWTETQFPFDRLPEKAKSKVRPRIWDLSQNPAGMCVRFVTDATELRARWTVASPDLAMNHMPATGVSGLDLYVREEGRWRWLAVGAPEHTTTSTSLVANLSAEEREYALYLPLYNRLMSLELGLPASAHLKAPRGRADNAQPIVFYGTSITQGGCASRPGMGYSAILGRRLERPIINLGFSANGTMDPELADLLGELDAAVYVVDCLPNMTPAMVEARAAPFVTRLRQRRPQTPILLVEDRVTPDSFLQPAKRQERQARCAALRHTFQSLVSSGDEHLAYLSGDHLLALDGEDTVDGSHPTDLGFVHIADAMQPAIEKLLH